jgi:segregation and condensation protein B
MTREQIKGALEALLFITDRPLPVEELKELAAAGEEDVSALLEELRAEYEARGGVRLLRVAEGWQLATRSEHGEAIRRLYQDRTTFRLSTAALETLAIVAYRQPLTRAEVEEIRGVEVIAALETLLEKRLLKVVGRKEAIGRPLLYGTTQEFLRQFGLGSLEDLPALDTLPVVETPAPAGQGVQGPFSADAALDAQAEMPLGVSAQMETATAVVEAPNAQLMEEIQESLDGAKSAYRAAEETLEPETPEEPPTENPA